MSDAELIPGSPCWVELATDRPENTMAFYSALFGWEYELARDTRGHDYLIATAAGEPVAGLRPHSHSVRDWTIYLAADLATVGGEVRRLGGTVLESQPHTVPGVGAKILIDDSSGTTVGLAQPSADWAFAAGTPGALGWVEVVTRHAHHADRFLTQLFGYRQHQFGDGKTVDYLVYYAGADSVIGRVRMDSGTPSGTPARWIAHFRIQPDVGFEQTVRRARAAGARLRFPPYPSTLGKVAVLSDPHGTRFAIIDPALASGWDHTSAVDDPYDD